MPAISHGDRTSFVRTTDTDNLGLWSSGTEADNCTKAVPSSSTPSTPSRPTSSPRSKPSTRRVAGLPPPPPRRRRLLMELSLWKQDVACLEWLDVYASFGSLTSAQLAEFAWGLAATRRPFLWRALPPGFLAETAAHGDVVWCPQERVLRQRAVGCFLTRAQRVELDVRGPRRRRAHGVLALADVRGPVHQLQVLLRAVGRRAPLDADVKEGAGRRRHVKRRGAEQHGEVGGGGGGSAW
ncbi:hypothetical protein HU200_019629 [Digitaria exilis]|uniref:Uncharacterized protein n=1 Tax=Digitaria exilis TaxID=1010633 RepID=A0A835KF38_9POAL|nr:hypothetical protein HU200_019629 [Digitaria exilis]